MTTKLDPTRLKGVERDIWVSTFAAALEGNRHYVARHHQRDYAATEADEAVAYIRRLHRRSRPWWKFWSKK